MVDMFIFFSLVCINIFVYFIKCIVERCLDHKRDYWKKQYTEAQESLNLANKNLYTLLDKKYDFGYMFNSILKGRLGNAFYSDLQIKNLNISADIQSGSNFYHKVTLQTCSCADSQHSDFMCKHRLFLAYSLGILQVDKEKCEKSVDYDLKRIATLTEESNLIKKQNKDLKKIQQTYIEKLKSATKSTTEDYPYLAAFIADLQTLYMDEAARILDTKKHPAHEEARRIRELRKETQDILQKKKELEYKLAYIEDLFPNINDIFDSGFNEENNFELETKETTDRVRFFLSQEEFNSLSTTDKNQLALNRYIANRKSKWQIGRDYEMYIGHLYEKQGYQVQYTGIIKNFEDMGRDLIVTNGSNTFIIQCKNWSKEKTIHEKHIFQLFGTVVLYNIDHPDAPASGVFVSTTKLSEKAARIADELNIRVSHKELGSFPRIKCNINRMTGERIYHLPFDQQYDKTTIEPTKGECYAFTVREAEDKGFRRAFKHYA